MFLHTSRDCSRTVLLVCVLIFVAVIWAQTCIAQEEELPPLTGVMCFGDSITFGVGDQTFPDEEIILAPTTDGTVGYPARLSASLGIEVDNDGLPGEIFTTAGLFRFVSEVISSSAEVVVLLEGSNDAIFRTDPTIYQIDLQRAVNVAKVLNKRVILATLPQPCCERISLLPFVDAYSDRVREVAFLNDLPVADIQEAWQELCPSLTSCELLNRPEGLHPNTLGYDVIAEVVLAAIQGRDPVLQPEEDEIEEDLEQEEEEAL